MHGRHEMGALGNTLNIEMDLENIKSSYTLDILEIRESKIKTTLAAPAPLEDWGCCPKK
jgi:hypothetical protein